MSGEQVPMVAVSSFDIVELLFPSFDFKVTVVDDSDGCSEGEESDSRLSSLLELLFPSSSEDTELSRDGTRLRKRIGVASVCRGSLFHREFFLSPLV